MGIFSFLMGVFFTAFMIGIIINHSPTFWFGVVGMAIICIPISIFMVKIIIKEHRQQTRLK